MLVLTRREGERVVIASPAGVIVVTVCQAGSQVKLGFHAPDGVRVDREEVAEARDREARS